jgi:3-deoxy-D-manno-octulosonic-acid transferase
MTLALYSLLMRLLQPALRWKLRRRARAEPGYAVAVDERFGYYTQETGTTYTRDVPPVRVWLHSVSLGETRAAAALVVQLRVALPGMTLVLTHGTATGREHGKALLQEGDIQVWQPWDTPEAVSRFLAHFRPNVGLLMETEIWPNLVDQCRRAKVPLCLVNARLSEKSLRQAQRLAWLAGPAYQGLTAVWAQSQADADRLVQIGAPVQGTLGNLKFDATPPAALVTLGLAWRDAVGRPIIVLANSREGEEDMFLQVLQGNVATAPVDSSQAATKNIANAVQWMLVPRHPQRFDEVAQKCQDAGFSVSRRSLWSGVPGTADILLGDSLGEMTAYYAMSDVALMGGSFAALGGHNLIEATACDCPVVLGPHTFNFALASTLAEQAGAAQRAPDMQQAVEMARALVRDAVPLRTARQAARTFSQAHQGAAERTAAAVRALLLG